MATLSALERIQKLDAERETILAEAKEASLAKAREAIAELNALGFSYEFVDGKKQAAKGKRQGSASGACPICAFETKPPHDRRKHRFQGQEKKPLIAASWG